MTSLDDNAAQNDNGDALTTFDQFITLLKSQNEKAILDLKSDHEKVLQILTQESEDTISALKMANTTLETEQLELLEANKLTGEELKKVMNERDVLKRKDLAWQEQFKTFQSSFNELTREYQVSLMKIETMKPHLVKIKELIESMSAQAGMMKLSCNEEEKMVA